MIWKEKCQLFIASWLGASRAFLIVFSKKNTGLFAAKPMHSRSVFDPWLGSGVAPCQMRNPLYITHIERLLISPLSHRFDPKIDARQTHSVSKKIPVEHRSPGFLG